MFGVNQATVILLFTASAWCYCPRDKIHSFGECFFRVLCHGSIRGVALPNHCRGATNYPVVVDLTLSDADERYNDHITETEFLSSVTTFRATAKWPKTNLSVVKYMPLLKHLFLTGNQIKKIDGEPFYTLAHLEHIDLSNNLLSNVEDLFQFEQQPNRLKFLSLADNKLNDIPGDTFSELSSLIVLDLSYNQISDLDEEPFLNLTNLETLRLNNNQIKDLDGAIIHLQNLKHLYLRGNQIHNIDEPSLRILQHLETFDISGNQLDRLKPVIFLRHWDHFGGICKILLSENQITSVPNGTSKEMSDRYSRDLTKQKVDVLTELDLSKNEIESIEFNAFQSIIYLTTLDLSKNKLIDFIVNTNDLKHVKFLNLSCNHITNLYFDSFSSMTNLQNLDLSNNSLSFIPDETFNKNHNLKYVNMTSNEIKVLKALQIKIFHPEGGILDLSKNGLSKLSIPRGDGLRLTMLILHSNDITDAAEIKLNYQTDLKTLEMNNNQIQKLNSSSLCLPSSVTTLNLESNKIQEIGPSTFHRLTHLKTLFLGHNRLTSLEYGAFQGLTDLSNLDLSFNHIPYLDSKQFTDLKSLAFLALRYNGLSNIEYNGWLNHRYDLQVYLEGNSFKCDWLAKALRDYNNGFSKMRPTVNDFRLATSKHSLEGVPCIQYPDKLEKYIDSRSNGVMADERLLLTNQRILEAVKEQTRYLRVFMHSFNVNSNNFDIILKKLIKSNEVNDFD